MADNDGSDYIELTADIVSAYVSNNSVPASELPALINDVYAALSRVVGGIAPVGMLGMFSAIKSLLAKIESRPIVSNSYSVQMWSKQPL